MKLALLVVVFALSACAPTLKAREGPPVQLDMPQAAEQCAAQPDLDWCRHEVR